MKALQFRLIGPFRGGRVIAVSGVKHQPLTYYFGATGGGIFKTTDGGDHWQPITDGQVKTGSVGAIAVAESDPNVIYAGMGEGCIRGNASHGDGVYKSIDAGRTWKNVGLADTQQIGRIRIDSKNPNIVFIAALGHMSGPNEERGVFRSKDGGKTWQKVLFKSNKAGAIDLAFDPGNSNVLYAAFWQVIRKPWTFESGGPDSALYKSTDGGDTWTDITRNKGLPSGVIGRIGVTVSPVNGDRVWAIVEAEEGGVFRSDDAGKTWSKINDQRSLRQRAWYYSHIFADPKRLDTVYVLNTGIYRSEDGGKTFSAIHNEHGDNHDLWIAPEDPDRMIEGNDGGAEVSLNGGKSWSPEGNQPTAQFYRVALDNQFPYRVFGAQQDNSTVEIASRSNSGPITERDWHSVGGGESGWIAPDPKNPAVVYAGSYDGLLTRYDHRTGATRNVTVWPDNPMGSGVEVMKYRFQWNFPLLFSPHDPKLLYAGANVLLKTVDEGQHWAPMSPDLTRNDKSKQGPVGGPITKDNTAVEYYGTIFTVDESPVKKGVIWTGSDDGLIYLTQDGGARWTNVTPNGLPDWIRINSIAASPHDPAVAYFAATLYLTDDFRPFLYKTSDYGKTWTRIVQGIPAGDFTRAIREDPHQRGLLVAGTETGLYISYDDGGTWRPFQLNLPVVPITDLAFQPAADDLVVATQGRAFYILDDMPMVRSLDPAKNPSWIGAAHLFTPKDGYRLLSGGSGNSPESGAGTNPPNGIVVNYWFPSKPKGEVTLEFLDTSGKLIRKVSSNPPSHEEKNAEEDEEDEDEPRPAKNDRVAKETGMNRFVWDMHYEDATRFPGMILWAASTRGPVVVPGRYRVRLQANGQTQVAGFQIKKDPRAPTTPADFQRQLALALQLRDKLSQANQGVVRIRAAEEQLNQYESSRNQAVSARAHQLADKLKAVEEELYQTKLKANEDALNFPIKLNNKIAALLGTVMATDIAPTAQSSMVFEDLATKTNAQLKSLDRLLTGDVAAFNKLVRDQNVPAIVLNDVNGEANQE